MAIFMTDTHGYFGRLRPAAFREQGDLSKDNCRCREGKSGAAPLFPLLLCDKNGKMSQ